LNAFGNAVVRGATILGALMAAPLLAANAQTGAVPEDAPPAGLWERAQLTGDWGGLRTSLEARGITLDLTDTSEVLGNVSGGMKQGAVFDGKTEIDLAIDLEKLVGWTGGRFKVSAYQIHGRDLSTDNIGNLLTVSNIEAVRGTPCGPVSRTEPVRECGECPYRSVRCR
jgi:porin